VKFSNLNTSLSSFTRVSTCRNTHLRNFLIAVGCGGKR
jgi:hypothetical protein